MTTIGTFTSAKDGFLKGTIKTLTLTLPKVTFEPVTSDHESAPAFRIFSGTIEFGAAWAKIAKESGRSYHQVRLDDPSLPAPIFANLLQDEGTGAYILIWNRPKRASSRQQRREDRGRR